MKKRVLWIVLSIAAVTGAYFLSGIICGAVETASGSGRIIPIYCVDTDKKCAALTFDAAWGNDDTDILIGILNEYNAPATFFVTGQWAEKYPEDVKKLYDAGHDIANHSDTHPHISNMTYEELKADTERCNKKIEEITGEAPLLYRGPYGEYNNTLIEMLHDINMYYIQWDTDSLDWMDPEPSCIVKNVTDKVKSGSIVLLHNGAKNTPEALPSILKQLKDEGYEFVKVKDLIYRDNYHVDNTGKQYI